MDRQASGALAPAAPWTLGEMASGPALDPPIRSALFGQARFEQHGASLARAHEVDARGSGSAGFFPRLSDNALTLRRALHSLEAGAAQGRTLSPAAQWLLDSATLLGEQLGSIKKALPRSFYRRLPVMRDEPLAGLPRVYGVAWAWVAHADSGFDEPLLQSFLQAYQSEKVMTLGELWALHTTLRVVLFENLRRLAERAAARHAARDAAHALADGRTAAESALAADEEMAHDGALHAPRHAPDADDAAQRSSDGAAQPSRDAALPASRGVQDAALPASRGAQDAAQPSPRAAASAVPRVPIGIRVAAADALRRKLAARGVADAFLLTLWQRLDGPLPDADTGAALAAWWARHLPDPPAALAHLQNDEAEDLQSTRNAITTLRELQRVDWSALVARCSPVVRALMACEVHAAEDAATQHATLHAVEALARRSRRPETEVAAAIVALTGHANTDTDTDTDTDTEPDTDTDTDTDDARAAPAYWWRGDGENTLRARLGLSRRWFARRGTPAFTRRVVPLYLACLAGLTALALWALLRTAEPGAAMPPFGGWLTLAALLALWPLSEAVVALVNRLISESVPPTRLARLRYAQGLPRSEQCLVVMPVLLDSAAGVAALLAQLEQHALANAETHAQFALLSDYRDADARQQPEDEPLLHAARDGIDALNLRYPAQPPKFLLLHREREWSHSEQRWIGWERKRGKLEQLVRALVDPAYRPFIALGAVAQPALNTRHLITLDADTDLPPGRLRALVGTAAHPMNRPRWDAARQAVTAGYGILQPRVETPLPSPATATRYHALFNGQCGLDPYSAASSEVYQDVFGEGSFAGKGLIDVRTAQRALAGRLPEGQVLSHDLLEGSLVRCATVSDITVVEDAPLHADVAASRLHRWARGDWQLLPFLFGARHLPLAGLQRWKMADNLRRSLVAPASLALLLLVAATGVLPWGWTLGVVLAAFGAGPLLGAVAALAPSRDDIALVRFYRQGGADLARAVLVALWHLAQLLQLAALYADAVARALWRQAVSRRHLLQWTPAATAQATASTELAVLVRRHWRTPALAAALAVALLLAAYAGAPVQGPAALALLGLWALSPLWTWWASRPSADAGEIALTARDTAYLHDLARDTWRFFESHVGAADSHLPPDNVQLAPHTIVAHRTSPTNIGLYLLSAVCARELGFIATPALAERLRATLDTVERLPKHQGHLLNWYDTRDGSVLPPAYVSTVDSGNLAGHLLVVAQACEQLAAGQPPLREGSQGSDGGEGGEGSEGRKSSDGSNGSNGLTAGDHGPVAAEVLQDIAQRARRLALAMDFKPLYDPRRKLFFIGLHADSGQHDSHHYDLLASEARLASLVAIAKGDAPVEHWAALGRPFFARGRRAGLKSWSGSMFEYLMPTLIFDEPIGSALQQASASAVAEQQRDGDEHGTPWGVSESAIAAQDHTLAYQYGPQGVARLALRRTPVDERVVAPYASALALLVDPAAATNNLRALEALGARRTLGFIEAIDFSPKRQAADQTRCAIESHMAHHQAMVLVAAASVLSRGAPQRWARHEPLLRAVAGLLHERVPRETAPLREPQAPPRRSGRARSEPWSVSSAPLHDALPPTQWLGNGRYAVVLRSHGAGLSQWQGQGLTRWRDDALRDDRGTFVYLQREGGGARHSVTAHPAADPRARYACRMLPDRVIFEARFDDLTVRTTVWVSPEDDCELRQVELEHSGSEPLPLTLSLALEPTLAPQRADEAHPAFSNLFVQASWHEAEQALYLRRKPRLGTEREVHAVLALAHSDGEVIEAQPCADRLRWRGRYGSAARPVGDGLPAWAPAPQAPQQPLQDNAGPVDAATEPMPGRALTTGLDPMAVLSLRLRLAPGATQRLTFVCAAADTQETLEALIDKYRQPQHVERASSMAYTMASILLHDAKLGAPSWAALLRLQTLLSSVISREPWSDVASQALCDKRTLFRFGLGGERPLLLVTIRSEAGLELVQTLVRAQLAWAAAGQGVDVVVINGEPLSYDTPVAHQLQGLLQRQHPAADHGAARPALRLLRESELGDNERSTLNTWARLRLLADGRSLHEQLQRIAERHAQEAERRQQVPAVAVSLPWSHAAPQGQASTPEGEFSADDGRFTLTLSASRHPPRPWINVLANPSFGCHVSEMAGGHTWAGNSRMHQITRWANDPVSDPPGEWLLLQDLDSGTVWPLGRALDGAGPRTVEHGIGFTRMRQRIGALDVGVLWCVDAERAVKQVQLRLRSLDNHQSTRWRVAALVEWLLGAAPDARLSVATLRRDGVLLATQAERSGGFGDATAWLAWRAAEQGAPAGAADEWTCDRREFHGPGGELVLPQRLGQRAGRGLDPCAALARTLTIAPRDEVRLTLLLGHVDAGEDSAAAIAQALAVPPSQRLQRQIDGWRALRDKVQVHTPDARFNALINHWLPYQTVACRLWARAGYYQAGGAFGFRDQLQDAMSMTALAPQLLAQQLRASAARQFAEGDVQHWWHLPGGAGVRTHFSDDRLWLPYALAHYVQRTADVALLDEPIAFLHGSAIPPGAEDIYETPAIGNEQATLYEHAARAVDRSLATGAHGLPLIGSGDWNDGMNRVGHGGRGESVWLGWFLCRVIDDLLPLARGRGDTARADTWLRSRNAIAQALDQHAWDGRWYLRAFFDDGTPLGAAANAEARIDAIAQAWAVLSGAGQAARAAAAMDAAEQQLWDGRHQVLRLLHPPLQHARPEAGYIQAYPPGVRENGGQYNHAAAWAAMAAARLQQPARAWRWWQAISPAHRSSDDGDAANAAADTNADSNAYGGEPYAVAGDIATAAPYAGRCGWSWYTGAAGWLWRAGVESLCGIVRDAHGVFIDPCLPPSWQRVRIDLVHDGRDHCLVLCATPAVLAMARQDPACAGTLPLRTRLPWSALSAQGFHAVDATATAGVAATAALPTDA
jgi:cyclic beta-1,2-glucan synthetase